MPVSFGLTSLAASSPPSSKRTRLLSILALCVAFGAIAPVLADREARAQERRFDLTGLLWRPLPSLPAQPPLTFTWNGFSGLVRLVPPAPPRSSAPVQQPAADQPTLGDVVREARWRQGVFPLVSMASRDQIEREIGPIPDRSALGFSRSRYPLTRRLPLGGGL